MPEFKDAAVWKKWFFLCITLAITHLFFGFATGLGIGASTGTEACFVIGYLGLIVGLLLALGILFTDELNGNKIALICFVVFAFVGGFMTLIGTALWGGGRKWGKSEGINSYYGAVYSALLGSMAALLGILAGIFGVLDLVGVGAG